MNRSDSKVSYILLGIVVLVWGPNPGLVRYAYRDLHPILFAAIRFSIAGVLMLLVILWREKDLRIRKEDWKALLLVGGLGVGLYQLLWSLGLQRTTATNSAILVSVQSVFGVVCASYTRKESVGKSQYLGMGLALVGVILVIMKPTARLDFSTETFRGDLLTLTAGIIYVIFFSIWPKSLLEIYSPLRVMGFCMVVGSVVLWMAVPFSVPSLDLERVRWKAWGVLGYASLVAGMMGHTLYYAGIGRVGVARTFIFMYFIPFTAAVFNHFFLRETLFPQQIFGGLIVLVGIHFALRTR